ncbi:MAG TPA: hypothetical protein DCQ26_04695 [Marinilabiliales bacterium]|nr:MAG: hypothetical protein A2W95_10665 [Bacteroidetes bacterium GWA2_40_14]OFX61006.1 MAG: hypothetical protein A2W84_15720 [Bacteroidetes bacterium GWC2_40_13]OFX93617.1 MAG: hypothetical protein A2W97_07780 [Bacteroidetes bacterium GWE2_40_63]OFZ28274.1 MAG: hypothetical protein A2437_00015 [Bacteroidetes bacterium RIFOXYC2_FULL_40_12]HAM97888.1 hypothetical protein [Marinilabiliales bacterium]
MKFKLIIFFTFYCLLCHLKAYPQANINKDSLDNILSKIENPKEKVDFIIDFLDEPGIQYSDSIVNYANRAFQIAQRINYHEGIINAMIKLANYDFRRSNYKNAMALAQQAKEMSEDLNMDKELAQSLSIIGTIYTELDEYDKSSQYFFKSLKLFEKIDYKSGIASSLGDIGMDFYYQNELNKALKYFNKSLEIANENNLLTEVKRQYNNLAVVYQEKQQYDSAIVYLRNALEINIKLGDKLAQGINLFNIGFGQMNQENFELALQSFQQSFNLFMELNNSMHIAECYVNFGFCYTFKNDTTKSIYYFNKAIEESQKHNFYRLISISAKSLDQIYTQKKDTLSAYKYVVIEKNANDSLVNLQKQKHVSKLELQYLFEKEELQNKLAQQTKNAVQLIIIFSLISGLIILGLLFSKHRLKSKYLGLEKEKIESELNIKKRELTVNLLALVKKNEILTEISEKLIHLEQNAKEIEIKKAIIQISQELRHSADDKMMSEFSTRFQEVHAGFYEKLLKDYPELTQNELKICAFLRLNMSTKEISELTGQRGPTIDHARYRLRKKLNLSSDTNLVTFLSQI